jgi:hypothetical protein|tara:strand:- start:18 stop:470 length:453 start_codon:yes stop_codon:yes gene_type:complete
MSGLTGKKYESFYLTTGSGADKIDSKKLTDATNAWAEEKAEGCQKYLEDPVMAPIIYQLQQMQDELDYLRTEITANKGKATFPGFGTSNSTALVGDTKLISIGANTTVSFGDMVSTVVRGKNVYTIVMTVTFTDPSSGKVTGKKITLTLT